MRIIREGLAPLGHTRWFGTQRGETHEFLTLLDWAESKYMFNLDTGETLLIQQQFTNA